MKVQDVFPTSDAGVLGEPPTKMKPTWTRNEPSSGKTAWMLLPWGHQSVALDIIFPHLSVSRTLPMAKITVS